MGHKPNHFREQRHRCARILNFAGIDSLQLATVYKGTPANTTTETSPGVFDYPYSDTTEPDTPSNAAAAMVNTFYVVNGVRDIAYLYGFNEQAFNFQVDNMGKGGKGGDPILVSVQETRDTDNAVFFVSFASLGEKSGRCELMLVRRLRPSRKPQRIVNLF